MAVAAVSTAVADSMVADLAGSMVAGSMAADSIPDLGDSTAAGSMAANLEGSAAAYFSGWGIRTDMDGIIILTTATTTANPAPRRSGTTAPIPRAITRT